MSNAKPRLLYYSDCHFFAGCENMLANFLTAPEIRKNYDVAFAYRNTPLYVSGLRNRIGNFPEIEEIPVNLFDADSFYTRIYARFGRRFGFFLRASMYLLLLEHLAVFVNAFKLKQIVFNSKFDLIHINNGGYPGAKSCWSAVLAASFTNQGPIVFVVNNIAVSRSTRTRFLDGWIDRLTSRQVTQFVTASKYAATRLSKVLDLPSSKVLALQNGIRPTGTLLSRQQARERLGISEPCLLLGMVAVLEPRKGHHVAIEAVAKLVRANPNIRFLIEGEGSEKINIIKKINSLGISQFVKLVGCVSNIADYYRALDILLVPSLHSEDFPNVVLEAMYFGIPVIGSNFAGISEQVVDGVTGYLIPIGDAETLQQRITTISQSPELLQDLGTNARKKFEDCYRAEKAVARYLQLYYKLTRNMEI